MPGIYVINADGSNEQFLYKTNEARSPDWSPDDSKLVFSLLADVKGGGQQCFTFRGKKACFSKPLAEQWRLAQVNNGGGGYTDLRSTTNALTPSWKADGLTIAFNDLSIGIMQMSVTNDYTPFPFVGNLNVTAANYNPLRLMSPQYSPDGKKIVYVVQQQPTWQIAVANADGSDQHLLTSNDPLADVHPNNVAPVWSPDGKQILFLSNRNGKWEFFLMNADGTNVHQVLKNVTDQITLNYSYNSDRMMSWTK
jgi:TolB protein